MNATRFGASLAVLVVVGGCAQAPRSDQTAVSSQPAEPAAVQAATQTSPIADRETFWRQLTQRFDRAPFALEYAHHQRGELVATYDGDLGTYVGCGDSVGVADAPGADRLKSRLVVRIAGQAGGASSVSTDTIHVVSLAPTTFGSAAVVTVRPDAPGQTEDGRYCWSTGAMERLAQAQ